MKSVRVSVAKDNPSISEALKKKAPKEFTLEQIREHKEKISEERGFADKRLPRWPVEKQWAGWALHLFINGDV